MLTSLHPYYSKKEKVNSTSTTSTQITVPHIYESMMDLPNNIRQEYKENGLPWNILRQDSPMISMLRICHCILPPTSSWNVENGWLHFRFLWKQIGISHNSVRSCSSIRPCICAINWIIIGRSLFMAVWNARQETSPTCIRDSTKLITAPGETATDFSLPASRKPTISTESTKTLYRNFSSLPH